MMNWLLHIDPDMQISDMIESTDSGITAAEEEARAEKQSAE